MYYRDKNGNKNIKENYERNDIIKTVVNISAPLAVGLMTFVLLYPAAIELFKINLSDKTSIVLRTSITVIITSIFFFIMFMGVILKNVEEKNSEKEEIILQNI